MIYVLRQGSKTIGLTHCDRSYIIGFRKVIQARNVHYYMHPEPEIKLLRGKLILHKNISFDTSSHLSIPKCNGSIHDPMNDGGFHLHNMQEKEFFELPGKGVGIICPYQLQYETDDDFVFKVQVVDPLLLNDEL